MSICPFIRWQNLPFPNTPPIRRFPDRILDSKSFREKTCPFRSFEWVTAGAAVVRRLSFCWSLKPTGVVFSLRWCSRYDVGWFRHLWWSSGKILINHNQPHLFRRTLAVSSSCIFKTEWSFITTIKPCCERITSLRGRSSSKMKEWWEMSEFIIIYAECSVFSVRSVLEKSKSERTVWSQQNTSLFC